MSEDQDQKTEEASEHHKQEMRKEGKVAQSHDLVSAAGLIGASVTLTFTASKIAADVMELSVRALRLSDAHAPMQGLHAAALALRGVVPALTAASVAALVAGVAQTKGLFSIDFAMPKLERLDPTQRFMQLFPSKHMATELGKSLMKIGVVALVLHRVITDSLPTLLSLGGVDSRMAAVTVGEISVRALMYAAACYAVLAALDFGFALHRYNEDAKQTKQEQKEEHKQEEGNPAVKRKMRQRARELLAQAKAGDLKTATVVVTNPTHYAVALRYDPEKDAVPMLVAKGTDDNALRIRKRARGYRIPIVENRPLARALHKAGKVGRPIPVEMYRAVAEIIAHVMRLRSGARSSPHRQAAS
jgi:flagellar biosynthetic protein FlhB